MKLITSAEYIVDVLVKCKLRVDDYAQVFNFIDSFKFLIVDGVIIFEDVCVTSKRYERTFTNVYIHVNPDTSHSVFQGLIVE